VSGGSLLFKDLEGSGHRARDAGFFFLMGALSMVGVPIFAGFASKLLFSFAALETRSDAVMLVTMFALGASSVLNAMYFLRTVIRIYTYGKGGAGRHAAEAYALAHGVPEEEAHRAELAEEEALKETKAGHLAYIVPAAVLTAANIFLGLFSWVVTDLIEEGLAMFFVR